MGRGCVKTPNPRVFGGPFTLPEASIVEYRAILEVDFSFALLVEEFSHSLGRGLPTDSAAGAAGVGPERQHSPSAARRFLDGRMRAVSRVRSAVRPEALMVDYCQSRPRRFAA